MSRIAAIILAVIAFGLGVGAGVLGLLWATGGNAEPSRDVQDVAPTLSLDSEPANDDLEAVRSELQTLNEKIDTLSTQIASGAPPLATAASAEATEAAQADADSGDIPERSLFRINTEESEARFLIDETLLGNRITVVGATNQMAGDVIVNFADPAGSEIGGIAVNARTLRTDNSFRDQAIRGQILQSSRDEFEFITFEPVSVSGLPEEPVSIGDELSFDILGNLTVRGTTREVTFNTQVTVVSADRLEGLARTEIVYPDFNIGINAPPNVTDIAETVILELDFAAMRVDE